MEFQQTNKEEISLLIAGDEKYFRSVFDKYYQGLVRFATSYIGDSHFAENIAQDAFVLLWEKREQLDPYSNLHAYLVKIVKLKIWNYLEKQKTHAEIENKIYNNLLQEIDLKLYTLDSIDPSVVYAGEINRIIEDTLLQLPEQTRIIFNLSRQECLSNKEIAQQMNISVKTVEFHITRSLKKLRIELNDYLKILLLINGL